MNSVIEHLAEQAAESVVAYDHDVMLRVEHEDGAVLEVPADFIFKFAQLIVQECASLAYDGPGGILEHFGFESGS